MSTVPRRAAASRTRCRPALGSRSLNSRVLIGVLAVLAVLVAACGSTSAHSVALGDASVDGGAVPDAADAGPTRCDSTPCAAGQYCFHAWSCLGACSDRCECYCDTLPDACPADSPCSGACGYFGGPGEVFSSTDGGKPFPDGQVHCYGS
jgi:hypothetical protein